MPDSLAQLLDARLSVLAARWPPVAGAEGDALRNPLAAPFGPLHYSQILEAVHTTDRSAWLTQVRRAGAARAAAGTAIPILVTEALSCLHTVRHVVLGPPRDGDEAPAAVSQQLDTLETEILSALLNGYVEGQERRADEQRLALEEVGALFKINSAANSTLDFDQVLDRVVEHVADAMLTDICSLFIYEQEIDQLVLRATRGLAPEMVGRVRLRLGEGITGWAARAGKPLALSDGWRDERFLHVPGVGEEGTRAILAVPIVLYTKLKLVGVITIQSYDARHFTERDIRFLETVAGEVAIAIENARLHRDTDDRLRQKVGEMTILQGVSASIAATLDLHDVARLIASEAVHLMSADASLLYEFRGQQLTPTATFGLLAEEGHRGEPPQPPAATAPLPTLDPETSVIARAVLAGRPVIVDLHAGNSPESGQLLHKIADDPSLSLPGIGMDSVTPIRIGADPGGLPFATQLCVPLLAPRSIVGGICIYSRTPRGFSEEQISLLLAFAREGAIAIENAHLYEEARHGMEMQALLLREMHHRVRNNLQRTASLLRMQAHRLPEDNPARRALQESVIRVQSIARVHDLLSRGEVGLTEVGAVANLACEVVNNTLGRPDLRVRWHVEPARLTLSSREAFPLTLLLTELLSNSVLHGFAGRDEGQVRIQATRARDELVLTIRDNGQGVPSDFDSNRDAHLGLEVVRRLGEQELGGSVSIGPNPEGAGTQTVLRFPYQPPAEPDPADVLDQPVAWIAT